MSIFGRFFRRSKGDVGGEHLSSSPSLEEVVQGLVEDMAKSLDAQADLYRKYDALRKKLFREEQKQSGNGSEQEAVPPAPMLSQYGPGSEIPEELLHQIP